MSKTQSHELPSAGRQNPPSVKFKIGGGAIIKSNHPLFPDATCTITALPSPDAAIVQLDESGSREHLLLKYIEPLLNIEQVQESNADRLGDSSVENSQSNSIEQPRSNYSDTSSIEELSPDEERERHRLELKVERAFYEAGAALRDLRDLRLYRSTHQTFEQYCQDRFGYTRRNANYLIAASTVVENLGTIGSQNDENKNLETKSSQVLPTKERQVRPLVNLAPVEQRLCWQQALDLADGKVPTGKIVKGIVERMREKPLYLASDFCFVGDVFTLTRLNGEERKYNGYPCVAIELNDFTINVDVYDATLVVKPENLKRIDDPDVRRFLPAIVARIRKVRSAGDLDRGANSLVRHLGQQTYLTPVEEKLLSCLEKHYQASL